MLSVVTCQTRSWAPAPRANAPQLPPLHRMARANNVRRLRELVADGLCDVNEVDQWGMTALGHAREAGAKAAMAFLLSCGARMYSADQWVYDGSEV